ncbi:hypothetical protein [Psychroflexus sediminis]|uniref:Uncharacterized protein n=1 Tax=Psychroflexus sediminis TaxID=470826 RepID=A0A1G7URE3_9FLAO|nr:hypothetical protein [Psychroflexus sediminis]SDG49918.1 hypothetical protein SAMN04488027_102229 [Psychroflexus sediminis]
MDWIELIGIFVTALFIGALFFYGFSVRGPWGSFWAYLLVLIGGIWLISVISDPVGPVYWNIAWFDFLFVGLLFALILSAATPTRVDRKRYEEFYSRTERTPTEPAEPAVAVGIWFWLMLLLIVVAIVSASIA